MNKEIIYLDNNATTPIDPRVLDAMMPFLTFNFANAASTHQFGLGTFEAVKKARKQVAGLLGAETNEIIFTSGATESINLAIKGVAEGYAEKGKHIVTVSTEHSAVLDTCKYLETKGYEVTYLPVHPDGLLDLEILKSSIRADTVLVSVMHVNNETGVIQPIQEISGIAHKVGALFMTDATQSVGKIPVDVDDLGVDLLTFSGHKIYGPKGIGALYIRQEKNRVKIPALLHGGGHERGMRSGTLNVPGIVALGIACEFAGLEMEENEKRIREMRDFLEKELINDVDVFLNGNFFKRIYNTSNIRVLGLDASVLIGRLKNIAMANGSACTSALIEPSHVLLSMGLQEDEAFSALRISIGKFNTEKEIEFVVENFNSWILRN